MPKPIVLIKFDFERVHPRIEIAEAVQMFSARLFDYHVFVIPQEDKEEQHDLIELKVFYEKDFTEIQFEELKYLIESELKNRENG